MIHDLTDLEPLVHQYDQEKVLVGPLLSLWTNSSFRVFNIAGKSSKIHETIGLGFFELEIDAQRRRADIVAALEGRFGEVESFDSQLEMAQTAHTLWANKETARFLATVSSEPKPCPTGEIVASPDVTDLRPMHAPQSADDQLQPTLTCDLAQISEPLYLHNPSDTDTFANPGTLAEPGSNLEIVRNLPAAVTGNSVWKKYQLWALSAAYLAACFVVGFLVGTMVFTSFISVRQTANEAAISRNAAASFTADNDPSQATGTVTIPASSIGTNREAQPGEAVRVTSPSLLTSQPGVTDGAADNAPLPGAQPLQNPSDQPDAAPDERQSQSPKSQGNRADDSISLAQSSPSQTAKTRSSAAEIVPLSIPQPTEVVPTQVFVSPASTQIMAGHGDPQLLPSDAAMPKDPEALSTAQQPQASNPAVVPLPRPRRVAGAVSSERPRRRIGPLGAGTRSSLLGLFGH